MPDQEVTLRIKGDGSSAKAMLSDLDKSVAGSAKGIADSNKKTAEAMVKVGAAVTAFGAGVTYALNSAADAAVAYGSEVVNIQRLTGLAAKESSDWAAIMSRYGVEAKQVALMIKTLSVAIEGHSEALNDNGIATQDANGKNRDALAVFADLAEWYSKTEDKALANTVANGALGKSYSALLPLLAGGRQGIEDLTAAAAKNGQELTQVQIDAVKAYSRALKDNEDAAQGLTVQVGLLLLPLKTQMTQALGGVLEKLNELDPALKETAVGIGVVAAGTADVVGPTLVWIGLLPEMAKGFGMIKTAGAGLVAQGGGIAALGAIGGPLLSYAAGIALLAGAYAELAPEAQVYAQMVKSGDLEPPSGWEQFAAPISTAAYWLEIWTGDATGAATAGDGMALSLAKNAAASDVLGFSLGVQDGELQKASWRVDDLTRSLQGLMVTQDSVEGRTRSATESQQANRLAIADLNDALARQHEVYKHGKSSADDKARADIAVAQAQQRVKDTAVDAAKAAAELAAAEARFAKEKAYATAMYADAGLMAVLAGSIKRAADNQRTLNGLIAAQPTAKGAPKPSRQILRAAGTITSGPEYALIGEGGYPETVASWDPRYRARTQGLVQTTVDALHLDVKVPGQQSAPAGDFTLIFPITVDGNTTTIVQRVTAAEVRNGAYSRRLTA